MTRQNEPEDPDWVAACERLVQALQPHELRGIGWSSVPTGATARQAGVTARASWNFNTTPIVNWSLLPDWWVWPLGAQQPCRLPAWRAVWSPPNSWLWRHHQKTGHFLKMQWHADRMELTSNRGGRRRLWNFKADFTGSLAGLARCEPAQQGLAVSGLLRFSLALLLSHPTELRLLADQSAGSLYLALREYIAAHLCEPLDRQVLAQAFGIHPNHVTRVFRQHGREQLVSYIRRQRLAVGASLLLSSQQNLAEVAARSGFADADYFGRCFKQAYGLTPMAYRHAHQGARSL